MSLRDMRESNLDIEKQGDVVVATLLEPQWTDDERIERLGAELFQLASQSERRKVVLDVGRVVYVTSLFLGKLIGLHRELQKSGGELVLCNLNEAVARVMASSRLLDYFVTAADVPAALALLQAKDS